ncbi:hypothetical protein [Dyadobacter pollutisoli]|uniref:Uncharacterized protein n=1 Tax=Dyadobacter pollutisoli TaxID=2910158 RepID=A0A9E8NE71_9BACT|nr:hypothetical protein [Dyadobacter pollutisoli]WAC13342.1 hypothetical protein ON006_05135 [Dyadobacter pollutisoli]
MSTFQTSFIKVVTGIFVSAKQEPEKAFPAKADGFEVFLSRIKANSHRIRS